MTSYFAFYKPVSNPTGMSGTVGGAISSVELLPRQDTLFAPRDTSEFVTVEQYRKFFIKQVYDATLTGVVVELVNVEYPDQISFNTTATLNDTTTSPTTAPDNVVFSGNSTTAIGISGATVLDTTIPIWVKQEIEADSGDDSFVAFQIRIYGTLV